MRYVSLTVVVLIAACGGGNSTRYFRVLAPAATRPDSCYQAQSLPAQMTQDEIAAQTFCGVGKKFTSSGVTSNVVASEAWTLVDVGNSKLYLVLSLGNASTGYEGAFTDGKFQFAGNVSTFEQQCGPLLTVCNGTCVNRQSDSANCGACGRPCTNGMQCRFGQCVAMCPTITQTCGGVATNTQNDNANCGFCGNVCMNNTVCSGGNCVAPCAATCGDRYNAADCGMPREFSETNERRIEFTVSGGALTGSVSDTQSFACKPPGCSTDFSQRCPTCAMSKTVSGRELNNVTEFESR